MDKITRLLKKYMQMQKDGYETVFVTTVINDLNNIKPIKRNHEHKEVRNR
jgi:hypothetical protein